MSGSMSSFFGDEEGMSNAGAGAAGAAVGSMFGPVGGAVGGIAGMTLNAFSSKGASMRYKRESTKRAYSYGQDVYDYANKGREEIGKTFDSKLSTARARFGLTGMEMEGSAQWASIEGGLIRERDEALGKVEEEKAAFHDTESYKAFGEDLKYMTRVSADVRGSDKNDTRTTNYKISYDDHGYSNERVFTEEQYGNLRTGIGGDRKLMEAYSERVRPSIDEWEKASFGGDDARVEFESMMDTRIDEANTWFDRQKQIEALEATSYEVRGGGGR